MTADPYTAERIGLDWLRAAVAPVGAFGRRHDETIAPYGPGDEEQARAEIAACTALAERLPVDAVERLRGALRAVPEPTPIVVRARAGDPLGDVDFYELGRFGDALEFLARRWDEAGGPAAGRPPVLERLGRLLAPGRDGPGFYLADAFGTDLPGARAALRDADEDLERRRLAAAKRVAPLLGIEPSGEEFVVMRDLFDGPLPSELRLVRETPAYRVAALTLETVERERAFTRVATAEETARRDLASGIAAEYDAVVAATRALGALDRLLSRVAFAQRWGGCVPGFSKGRLAFVDGVFAPLAALVALRGRRYTPIALQLAGVAVLSGPNMGGKSAALATAGFLCACASLGVPPCARAAELPLLGRTLWIGVDGSPPARLLSSYAHEIVRGRDALAAASPQTLVLIDEFARTTGPGEGRALLIALLEALRARGALALAATHFEGIAEAAGIAHLRIAGLPGATFASLEAHDLEAALDAIDAAMDYRIVEAAVASNASDALALAELLGLDAGVIARARAVYGGAAPAGSA